MFSVHVTCIRLLVLVLTLLILSDLVACVPFLFILACSINNIGSFRNPVNYAIIFILCAQYCVLCTFYVHYITTVKL